MKTCTRCKKSLDFSMFNKKKSQPDGYFYYCKSCVRDRNNSKEGLVSKLYNNQVQRSKKRGHSKPEYTRDELYSWIVSQDNFNTLYDNWVKSGYLKNLVPSIDRLDDKLGYSISNIQLITWQENDTKGRQSQRDGCNSKCRIVNQLTLDGEFIAQFHSKNEACRQTGIHNIESVCSGRLPHAGGYKWEYLNEQ